MASELGDFAGATGYADTAWRVLIQRPDAPRSRLVWALCHRCDAALDVGDIDRARVAASQAMQLAERAALAEAAHLAAGAVAFETEEWPAAQAHYEAAAERALDWASAQAARLELGDALLAAGNVDGAEAVARQVRSEELDDELSAVLLLLEGGIRYRRGDLDRAAAAFHQARDIFGRLGNDVAAAVVSLELGLVAVNAGDDVGAANHLSAAHPLSARPSVQKRLAELVAALDAS